MWKNTKKKKKKIKDVENSIWNSPLSIKALNKTYLLQI